MVIAKIREIISLFVLRKKWRKLNSHNGTWVDKLLFNPNSVKIGKGTYGPLYIMEWGSPGENLLIGNYCSIAKNVKFILGGNHRFDTLTSYPLKAKINHAIEATSKGAIVIEDDVWIGAEAMILSGITIGKGSVIAAGAVVAKNIEPYSIVVGNPGRVVKKRFSDEIIEKLLSIEFANFSFNQLTPDNLENVYKRIESVADVDEVTNFLK